MLRPDLLWPISAPLPKETLLPVQGSHTWWLCSAPEQGPWRLRELDGRPSLRDRSLPPSLAHPGLSSRTAPPAASSPVLPAFS